MSRKLLSIMGFITITFLAGCSSPELKVPLEDFGMVGVLAFDYIDEDTTKLTVAIPQFMPDVEQNTQIFTVHTDLVSDGILEVEKLSDKKIVLNQLRVVLINEEYARKGDVQRIIKHLYRSAEVGNKVYLAIVKDSGEDILKGDYPDKPNIDFYLNDLLQPSINTAFNPNTNIHDFIYTLTNPVLDPIIPVLAKKDDKVEIKGVALFKDKNMYDMITPEEALVIQALQGKKELSPLPLELNQNNTKDKILLDLIQSKVKMKSNKDLQSPKLAISLKIKGTLSEYKGKRENKLNTPDKLSQLEHDIDKQLEQEIQQFIEKTQKLEIDPIGLSENFRMYYKGKWNNELTDKVVRKLEVDIHVETSIISTGTLK
ncbi:Ger(x)C family spore germination protein [Lysinibacillus sp. UGB7]|uniref:Ger(x)C family spore germination protein n=1 Tax=Lysinibacillus sp. UGB7 TaxID=3411039 RepID=UPI003B7C1B32